MPELEVTPNDPKDSVKIQFAKMVLGTTAAFLASKLVDLGIDEFVASRRNKEVEIEQ